MQEDTVKGSRPLTRDDLARMRELAGYSIDRRDAELWAQNDVKFLVYDDSQISEGGYDSDDEVGRLEAAMHRLETADRNEPGRSRETSAAASKHASSCFCEGAPPFPRHFNPTRLKLFRPEKLKSCDHYVAVSYCWPAEDRDADESSNANAYKVRGLDGVVHPARAPAWALRRAIKVAASFGLNMIWIDQECLPQPTDDSPQEEKDEQQKGIQAMDLIYSRATVTAGLLCDAQVASQRHRDALDAIQSYEISVRKMGESQVIYSKVQPEPRIDGETIDLAMDVFESITNDRWYTRAWIAQEALSAGGSLLLVLGQGSDVAKQPDFQTKQTAFEEPKHWQSTSSDIFVIPIDVLRETLFLAENLGPHAIVSRLIEPAATMDSILRVIRVIAQTRERNERLGVDKEEEFRWLGGAIDKASSKCTINAAMALTLLKSRHCRDVQDRIAIVANMCNFQFRLNTSVMAKKCKSLKLALLTLAIANGDTSLLVPEAYAIEQDIKSTEAYASLLWPFDHAVDRLDYRHLSYTGLICPLIYSHQEAFSATGIRISARLWRVKNKIDMRPIQQTWSKAWDRLTRYQVHLIPGGMEYTADHTAGYISLRSRAPRDLYFAQELKKRMRLLEYPGEWPYGVKIPDANLTYSGDRQAQKDLGDMMFAVIRRLYEMSKESRDVEMRSCLLSLANSVWHCVHETVKPLSTLPDAVGDWLYSHKGLEPNSFEMLNIRHLPDGNVAQAWILERIMRDGYLWYGRYVSASTTNHEIVNAAQLLDSLQPVPRQALNKENPIIERQMFRNATAHHERVLRSENKPSPMQHINMDERKRAAVTEIRSFGGWSDEDEARRSRECAAFFDVDGPCVVAVPFNGYWEVLPRPSSRDFSVCWVVQKSSSSIAEASTSNEATGGQSEEEEEEEAYRVVDKVRGMFECMTMPRGRYIFT